VHVGDLVKMRFRGNGHPSFGLVLQVTKVSAKIHWAEQNWNYVDWRFDELVVVSEAR
jgi:hypothetical protein